MAGNIKHLPSHVVGNFTTLIAHVIDFDGVQV